jgi:hypothetical protein
MTKEESSSRLPPTDDSAPQPGSASGPDSLRDEALSQLMKRAFDEEPEQPSVDVLEGVQRKLNERSGGKFYADGWSTSRHPPFSTYFITSLMMLAVIAIIYAITVPLVGDPVQVPSEPEPVRVVPPR